MVGSLATRRLDLSAAFANRMIKEPPSERWASEPPEAWRDFAARRAEVRSAQAQRDQHQLRHLAEHLSGVAVYPIACLDKEPQSLSDLSSLATQVPEDFGVNDASFGAWNAARRRRLHHGGQGAAARLFGAPTQGDQA